MITDTAATFDVTLRPSANGMPSGGLPLKFDRAGNLIDRIGETLARELKAEIVRIGCKGTRAGFKFAQRMFRYYPELRGL